MIHALHNLYTATWANFWTPSVSTLAGLTVHFFASQARHERRHRELMAARGKGGESQ